MTKEEAKEILREVHENSVFSVRTALETFFPEFKVDYDEMVRKELIEFIDTNTLSTDERHSRWITWLEKQKYTKKDVDDAWLEGIANAKNELEKQGEQNLVDKAEPKFKVKYAGKEYNVLEIRNIDGVTFYGIEDEPNHIDYVKAGSCKIISGYAIKENGSPYPTKPAVFSKQNPADKAEPKFKVKYAGSEYNVLEVKDIAGVIFYKIEDEPNHIDYVKAENCEIISGYWTDEDERMFDEYKLGIQALMKDAYVEKFCNWILTLKQKLLQ